MAGKRKLEIILAGDAKGLSRALGTSQGAASKFETRMGKWGRSLAKIGRTAAIGLGAVGVGVAAGLADALGEAREAAKIQALTDQVIKTTGGAANVTSEQVSGFAESLSQLIGVDDEVIQGAENLILTFTNVRNEAGDGNDIFNQTTVAAMDMATALGTDANAAALQLGKALNDPIKGVTKLTRAGVTFSDEQKEMIKKLQESGDVLGAQKIILAEVGKEFGGAAAAAATPMDRLKVTVGNLKEKIGTALIPIVDKAAVWLSENLPGALKKAGRFFDEHLKEPLETVRKVIVAFVKNIGEKGLGGALKALPTPVKVIAAAVAALGIAIWAATAPISLIVAGLAAVGIAVYAAYKRFPAFRAAVQAVVEYVKKHWPKVKEIIGTVMTAVKKVIVAFVKNIGEKGLGGALKALPTPVKVIAAAVAALGIAIWAATAPISLIVAGLAAVGIAVYAAYKRFPAFRAAVQAVVEYVKKHWPKVKEIIGTVMTAVKKVIAKVVDIIKAIWRRFGNTILSHLRETWRNIKDAVRSAIRIVKGIIETVTALIKGDWGDVWDGIKETFGGVWDAIKVIVRQAIQNVKTVLRLAWNAIGDRVTKVWDKITEKVGDAISAVATTIGDVLTVIKEAWNTVWGGIKDTVVSIWDEIKSTVSSGINTVLGAINAIIRAWNRLSFHTPDISILGFSAPSFDWESPNIDEIPEVGRGRAGRSGQGAATVNVVINAGLGTDQRELRRTVAKALIEYASANGGIPLKIRSV